ncbi:MAG: extracellular solute-binding protein [Tissierellia bacterium]|nr:extracellular solute-binding protein [Tissierellia bacterium]
MVRKIISIILIGFILVWTYNLFIDNFITLEEEEEEAYRGIIKIWDLSRPNINGDRLYSWLKERIRAFERRNSGVYIELIKASGDDMDNLVKGNLSLEEVPDIIPLDSNFYAFDMLEPLDEYIEKEELEAFKHQILKSVTYNKELVAIPIGISTNVLYLNLDKFNERGVSPPLNGSWTYEEFVNSLEELTYDSDGDGLIDQYGFISNIGPNYYYIWGIILSDGAELINPKRMEYNFYGEKAIKGLERLINLNKKYKVTPDYFPVLSQKDAWDMFYNQQKVATIITGAWAIDLLENSNKSGEGFNFDIANFPTGDKNLPVVLSNDIVSYGILRDEDPKKIEMCIKFLKFLTSDSNQRSLEKVGLFTVKRGIKDMYMDKLNMKKVEESLIYTEYIPFMDNWVEIEAIIQEEIRKALLGEKASYEAIEDAKIEIDKFKE